MVSALRTRLPRFRRLSHFIFLNFSRFPRPLPPPTFRVFSTFVHPDQTRNFTFSYACKLLLENKCKSLEASTCRLLFRLLTPSDREARHSTIRPSHHPNPNHHSAGPSQGKASTFSHQACLCFLARFRPCGQVWPRACASSSLFPLAFIIACSIPLCYALYIVEVSLSSDNSLFEGLMKQAKMRIVKKGRQRWV